MRQLGWIEGKTAKFIMGFDDDDKSRLRVFQLARDVVLRQLGSRSILREARN